MLRLTRIFRWPALALYCLWIIIVTVLALPWLLSVWAEGKYQDEIEATRVWRAFVWAAKKLGVEE